METEVNRINWISRDCTQSTYIHIYIYIIGRAFDVKAISRLFPYGQEIIVPLKFFIGNKLQFPLMMHDAVRDSLTSIMDMPKSPKTAPLTS